MKTKESRKRRLSLTLLFSAIVIVIFIAVLLLAGLGIHFSVELGLLGEPDRVDIPTGQLLFIFICASITLGGAMTLFLSRIPMKPVNHLLNIMQRLAAGDFSPRIILPSPWNRHPGMRELAQSFNKMAEELESTEMLRSDFINNFSHEFKTPIVSIAGFAKLLKRESLTPQQAEYVRIIEEESRRLSQMATNVLDLTQVENQAILTDLQIYNLSEQLRSCILLLSSKWERKDIDFSLRFREHDIQGNQELLKHVWLNLLDNAIKFSPQASTVEIVIKELPEILEVSLSNPGMEITPEQQSRIFNKFYQADESHSSEGNGVGLAIVKKVVDLHGGKISVHSENGINLFTVQLPREH
ncbi:MAG: HAMP domain-containing sensor histidine kinase [Bacillota bacterium]|nr:HAMP domain-containing sensor histidine kinase [Bacillota bacterium]